jgi:hypothetical protein
MAKGSGMGPGGNAIRPIDKTHLGGRGAGVGDEKSFGSPAGYPTPKGESREGKDESRHSGKGEREAHIPSGGKHGGSHGGEANRANFDAELHDMTSHLGHHSAGSAHKHVWSGGGKTK